MKARAHLAALARREQERADRAGSQCHPDRGAAYAVWEKAAAWPEDEVCDALGFALGCEG